MVSYKHKLIIINCQVDGHIVLTSDWTSLNLMVHWLTIASPTLPTKNFPWKGRGQWCGLRKFRHSKSSVYRWYPQVVRGRFVYDTSETMKATRSRHGRVHMYITHCLQQNLQLHTIDLVRTCRISSLCTDEWQLARFQLTRRIARSLGDSWASCRDIAGYLPKVADFDPPHLHLAPS